LSINESRLSAQSSSLANINPRIFKCLISKRTVQYHKHQRTVTMPIEQNLGWVIGVDDARATRVICSLRIITTSRPHLLSRSNIVTRRTSQNQGTTSRRFCTLAPTANANLVPQTRLRLSDLAEPAAYGHCCRLCVTAWLSPSFWEKIFDRAELTWTSFLTPFTPCAPIWHLMHDT
jgi:hypothetical protein